MRGGEKVLEKIVEVFPDTEIITNLFIKKNISNLLASKVRRTSFIQRLPNANKLYQYFLPLYPKALGRIIIDSVDLVISSESGPAKGIQVSKQIPHICYTHSPMRYIWDMQDEYFGTSYKRKLFQPIINYLQKWDYSTAQKVDYIIANSNFIKVRIKRCWNRTSNVIYPPVNTSQFSISDSIDDFYLLFGQHVKYKMSDLAIRSFNNNKRKLVVMGGGEELPYLKSIANNNIIFLERVNDEVMKKYLSSCRALIFPGIEDFGIIPVEAMACGRPVIAYNKGGATETISENITGLFFDEQTIDSLNTKIIEFEKIENHFIPNVIRKHALKFDKTIFKKQFKEYVDNCINDFNRIGCSVRR